MPKLYRYKKITDAYTTHTVQAEGLVELCELDGDTIISVPDDAKLEASKVLTVQPVELTEELAAAIKEKSDVVQMVNTMVVEKIREKYDINDELKIIKKMLQCLVNKTTPDAETLKQYTDYIAYTDTCTAWGTEEKTALGVEMKVVEAGEIGEIIK
ncbi:MAG: hypothetical protein AB1423_14480 [Pseudomonadota bacterium]